MIDAFESACSVKAKKPWISTPLPAPPEKFPTTQQSYAYTNPPSLT